MNDTLLQEKVNPILKKKCPCCSKTMLFKSYNGLKASVKNDGICSECRKARRKTRPISRLCPTCSSVIFYTNAGNCYMAEKDKKVCKKCAALESSNREDIKRRRSELMTGKNNPMFGKTGEKSSFYGRSHTDENKEKSRQRNLGRKHKPESIEKMRKWQSENNAMEGRSVFSVWIEKYGEEEAEKRMRACKEKHRQNTIGEKNNMYGKPSPNGSGNGYSGWYNGKFFRSLRELVFISEYLERFNLSYRSLEKKEFRVPYFDNFSKTNRNYFGDYLVNGKYFVEIKPKKLWNTPLNSQKFAAARLFCEQNGLKFKLISPKINPERLFKLCESGKVKFTERYEKKFQNWKSKYLKLHA